MAKFAFVKNSDDSIDRIVNYDTFDAAAVAHKFGAGKEFRVVPVVKDSLPSFDPATHRLGPEQTAVEAKRVRKFRVAEAIPAKDLSEESDRKAIKALVADLSDGSGTAAQRIKRCERVLIRLIRESF